MVGHFSHELCRGINLRVHSSLRPGDHVIWKGEDEKQPAIVQFVNASERTASIALADGSQELASVLELDPHGAETALGNSPESFGVRRGDYVFIHREGTTNGCQKPRVPRIGELEGWVQEAPFVEENGELGGWRKELDTIGSGIAHARGREPILDGQVRRPAKGDPSYNWFGEVSHVSSLSCKDMIQARANSGKAST